MAKYNSIEYQETDSKITIDWKIDYDIKDLEMLNFKALFEAKKILEISKFKLISKTIDSTISLGHMCFIDSFSIMNCKIKEPVRLESIRVSGNCTILYNTFNEFTLCESEMLDSLQIGSNKSQTFKISSNKLVGPIYFHDNNINDLDIKTIQFIDRNHKTISPSAYFKNLKKTNLIWDFFRMSLCNLKGYFVNNNDYFTSKAFESLEEKAYFESCFNPKFDWAKYYIYTKYWVKKHISLVLSILALTFSIIATITTIVGVYYTYLSYCYTISN